MLTSLLLVLSAVSGDSEIAPIERALASVRTESICADVRFIASDELEGRDSPSQGLRLAARFLRARLERLGFQPGGDDGFFDRYELEQTGLDLDATTASVVRAGSDDVRALAFGRDYAFWGSGEHELDGPIVYIGAGGAAELEGVDLAGKWALVVDGDAPRTRESYRASMERSERLRAAGALGILSAPAPGGADAAERDARLAETAEASRFGRMRMPGEDERMPGEGRDGRRERPRTVSLLLSSTLAGELLGTDAPKPGTELGARLRDRRKQAAPARVELENVAGLWPGTDLAHEVIVLSAHYDHVGVSGGEIYNGADDNGSGTCGLLAVAEALRAYGPLRRSVLLLWVSAEEKGLFGSAAWTKDPTLPEGMRAVCNLNVDMIGRNAPEQLLITPTKASEHYNGLTRLAERLAPLEGFPVLGDADEFWGRSDHANFARNLGIPVAFLFSDVHEDYHQPGDDVEKLDCDKVGRVVRLLVRMLHELQADELGV
jgi:hypothetical protein